VVGSLVAEETSEVSLCSINSWSILASFTDTATRLHGSTCDLVLGNLKDMQLQEDGGAGVPVKCLGREHHAPR
jgi:hypothetical protein